MRDTYGEPVHIEVLTDDTDVMRALWQLQNDARDLGDDSFQVSQLLQRSATLAEVHQVWVIFNDVLKSATFLLPLYLALKPAVKSGKRFSIRVDAGLKIDRDALGKLSELGCTVTVVTEGPEGVEIDVPVLEATEEVPSLPDNSEEA